MRNYILLAILLLFILSCNNNILKKDGIVVGIEGDPQNLDPRYATSAYAERIIPLIFNSLVKLNKNSKVIPDLAKSWEISSDGKTYIFYLRKGVFFHNGKEFTSYDVKYTFSYLKDPKNLFLLSIFQKQSLRIKRAGI